MKRSLIALAVSGALVSPVASAEFRIDRLLVVGDSLSDGGAYTQTAALGLAGAGVPAQAIPNRLRFTTNGPGSQMWGDVLAGKLGIPFDVDVLNTPTGGLVDVNGGNYAQGGSRVSNPAGVGNNGAGITTIPVSEQVTRLLADRPVLGRNDLIALWAGANDGFIQFQTVALMGQTPQQALGNMVVAANDLLAQIDRLKAAGAQNIVVITVPNLGITPSAALINQANPGSGALLTALSDTFNNTLMQAAAQKDAVVVDANQLLGAVLADPQRYGFSRLGNFQGGLTDLPACGLNTPQNPNDPFKSSLTCIQGVNASPDSESVLFADGVHPTAAAQRLFGEAGFAGLRAAGLNGSLVVAPLTPIRQHALSLENRLTSLALVQGTDGSQVALRPVGHVDWYGGAETGRFRQVDGQVQPGLVADTTVIKVGADRMVTRNALVGAGISYDHARTAISNRGGSFKNDVLFGTVFTTIALSQSIYANAAYAIGKIDYDINRQFTLGPSLESYQAETEAQYRSARIGLGHLQPLPAGWLLNPQIAYTDERVEMDGYDESRGAASLSFGDTQYEARRVSVGALLTRTPSTVTGWRPLLRYSFERDLNDDDIVVRMGPNQQTLARIFAPRPDRSFQLATLGAAKPIGPGLLNLQLTSTVGQAGLRSSALGVAYKIDF